MTIARAPRRLSAGAVHVWLFDAPVKRSGRSTDDLRHGAARRRPARLRSTARKALLSVLADYLAERRPRIAYGPQGRPALPDGGGLDFNVAHSGGRIAIAVTRGARVGIDIERLREVPSAVKLATEVFGPDAAAWLAKCAEPKRSAAFLTLWTLLEAAVKAAGHDMSQSFARFRAAALAAREGLRVGALDLRRLRIGGGYAAALALDRPIQSLKIIRAGEKPAGPISQRNRRRR